MWRRLCSVLAGATGIIGGTVAYQCRDLNVLYPVTEAEVIHAWLRAESLEATHQFAKGYSRAIGQTLGTRETPVNLENGTGPESALAHYQQIIATPDFHNAEENTLRRAVFQTV